jgi:hypothetical protein
MSPTFCRNLIGTMKKNEVLTNRSAIAFELFIRCKGI